jgi:hypothetical protein
MIFRKITLAGCLVILIQSAYTQQGALSANSNTLVTRTPDSRGWTDPALNHNKLLQQTVAEGRYVIIGTYKVKGSPYLFGGNQNADLFTPTEKAYNINVSYNTYNQEVEFTSSSNPTTPLVKEPGEVDSFIIKQDAAKGMTQDIKLVYAKLLGSSEKTYFQELEKGSRFSLYKRYKSDLGYVPDNYVQPELRQFDLLVDYYYYDAEKKTLKKLKTNHAAVIKEFKSEKDVTPATGKDDFSANPEISLRKIIRYLNS